jgi:hypothetical protein
MPLVFYLTGSPCIAAVVLAAQLSRNATRVACISEYPLLTLLRVSGKVQGYK